MVYGVASYLRGLPSESLRLLDGAFRTSEEGLRAFDLLRRIPWSEADVRDRAFARLGYCIRSSSEHEIVGGYVSWLVARAVRRMVHDANASALHELLEALVRGGPVLHIEEIVARHLVRVPFVPARGDREPRRLALLGLSWRAREVLSAFCVGYDHGYARELELVTPSFLIDRIEPCVWNAEHVEWISAAIATAIHSPLAAWRLTRVAQLLARTNPLTATKLAELADPHLVVVGSCQPHPACTSSPARSQFDGYVGERAPVLRIERILRELSSLLDAASATRRAERRIALLAEACEESRSTRGSANALVASALRRLGDDFALAAARAIDEKRFDLEILSSDAYDDRHRALPGVTADPRTTAALYFHRGAMRGKALMLIRAPHGVATPERLFGVLVSIVHEVQHDLDIDPCARRTMDVHLREEMSAHLREAHWAGVHGDPSTLVRFSRDGHSGLALLVRDVFDSAYSSWWAT
jgi:hypothetical protein